MTAPKLLLAEGKTDYDWFLSPGCQNKQTLGPSFTIHLSCIHSAILKWRIRRKRFQINLPQRNVWPSGANIFRWHLEMSVTIQFITVHNCVVLTWTLFNLFNSCGKRDVTCKPSASLLFLLFLWSCWFLKTFLQNRGYDIKTRILICNLNTFFAHVYLFIFFIIYFPLLPCICNHDKITCCFIREQ